MKYEGSKHIELSFCIELKLNSSISSPFFYMIRCHPESTLFPYTTLFRSSVSPTKPAVLVLTPSMGLGPVGTSSTYTPGATYSGITYHPHASATAQERPCTRPE